MCRVHVHSFWFVVPCLVCRGLGLGFSLQGFGFQGSGLLVEDLELMGPALGLSFRRSGFRG